eukprot:CAMPEP_0183402126 /NCGR_PEP_ID=MMETSP0370-20130417/13698_1 /TAXON_ID=268820 /ORGANISM="Peridinium aciculiferum, Strain PAER-2" /LENGTH=48 /DNA_ID= /DNA_START= /DNA_END= /DNA_ORIENTATION=
MPTEILAREASLSEEHGAPDKHHDIKDEAHELNVDLPEPDDMDLLGLR